ncbi:MAG: MFS transporter [Acidobacteria bacterium]|nr:MFS transporter [Acidobacteriota bacterium]
MISFSGSFMQGAALLWHVSLLVPEDRRALALGLVGLTRIGPVILFSLVSGVAADALDRRKLMIGTQSIMAALAAILALLTFRGLTTVWPLYAMAACSSAAGAFDLPARQALVPNLVPRAHLPNAISLNTIMIQIASVAGPGLGGLIIATGGVAWTYALNSASFLVVIAALLMMRVEETRYGREAGPEHARGEFTRYAALEGLRFVFRSPLIRSTMLLDFFATFFSSATALLPIFAQDVLRVAARGYGWLYAAPAAGALVASIVMIRVVDWIERRGLVLIVSVIVYGAATAAFGLAPAFWIAFTCLAVTGAADTVSMVFRNLIRQLETPDHLRGRMTGVNMVFFMGGPQLGELEAGLVANWFGPIVSVVTGGIGCIVATVGIAATTPVLRAYGRTAVPMMPLDGDPPTRTDTD